MPCRLSDETRERALAGELLALPALARFELDHTALEAARADDELPRQADQVHVGELGAGTRVAVVVEHLDIPRTERGIDFVARFGALGIARPQVDETHLEGCNRFGPDDAVFVVARLDDGTHETGHAD